MGTLATILKDNWEWRPQILKLAVFELRKKSRGAALGWAWFFIKPIVYIFCFWFALDLGLRASQSVSGQAPYILWLTAGLIPWFFIKDILGGGIDVYNRYPYLVNKIKFPLSAISNVYVLAMMIIHLLLEVMLFAMYFACGQPVDLYLLQVPVLIVLMYAFWVLFSIFMSPLCAMSKDVKNLMGTLSTPFFWLSGVLFNVKTIDIDIIQTALYFNPITFFVTGFRDALYDKVWVWEDPMLVIGFVVVFMMTLIAALVTYKRTNEEVADVL